ncbi:unnamed protein product, partial [Prorocentrum cordatum]
MIRWAADREVDRLLRSRLVRCDLAALMSSSLLQQCGARPADGGAAEEEETERRQFEWRFWSEATAALGRALFGDSPAQRDAVGHFCAAAQEVFQRYGGDLRRLAVGLQLRARGPAAEHGLRQPLPGLHGRGHRRRPAAALGQARHSAQ